LAYTFSVARGARHPCDRRDRGGGHRGAAPGRSSEAVRYAAIFLLLLLAFIRVDAKLLRLHLRHPSLVIAATAWTSVGIPILCGIAGLKLKLDLSDPQLFLSLMLQSVAPPMMAAPALAALLGLDATLVLITLVTSAALNPLTAPVLTYAFDRFWGEADTEGKNETLSPLAWSATTSGPGKARSANTVSRTS